MFHTYILEVVLILNVIAMVSMLIDHIGYFFFPDVLWLRIIGRIAFPVYAYCCVMAVKNKKDLKQYLNMLIVLASVSQLPFYLLTGHINIIYHFLFFTAFFAYRNDKLVSVFVVCTYIVFIRFGLDYGLYGLVVLIVFYIWNLRGSSWRIGVAALAFESIVGPLQILCILSIPFLKFFKDKRIYNKNFRLFYRSFYPLHLIIIFVIKQFM